MTAQDSQSADSRQPAVAVLVRAARHGDRAAREQLARDWARCAFALCYARVQRGDVAEDLAQESLLRALLNLDALKGDENFGGWLRGIAQHVCQDWQRRQAREAAALRQCDAAAAVPFVANEENDLQRQLARELHQLPEDLREAVCLHYFENLSYQQIAELLGVARSTVNSRLNEARRLLAQRLRPVWEESK